MGDNELQTFLHQRDLRQIVMVILSNEKHTTWKIKPSNSGTLSTDSTISWHSFRYSANQSISMIIPGEKKFKNNFLIPPKLRMT